MNEQIHHCDTPFGAIELREIQANQRRAALLQEPNPQAAIYAAKTLGITRLIEPLSGVALDRLLTDGAIVVPHDLIDLTVGRAATFFVGKGYGFLGQQQVFCPELRQAAQHSLEHSAVRSFARGTLAVLDDLDVAIDRRWNAQIKALRAAPAAYLAKELELCYLPLVTIGQHADLTALIAGILAALPADRSCPCATAMQATRERGLIADDWRSWL
jgi:5'-methylthioadenosine phosphorylase